jgi:site-specific recombinase XerD
MPSDTRKKLRNADITCYSTVIQTFSERLQYRNFKDRTFYNYVSCLKIFFAWCVVFLASKSADLLDYDDYRLFLGFLDMEKLEPRTINVYIATLKQFRYHIQQKSWSKYEISFRKYDRTLPCVPSVEQASAILAACNTMLETALVKLLLSTGVRISEACALRFGDIRRDKKQIYIRPSKGRSDRYVPLDDSMLLAMESYCRERYALCRKSGLPLPDKNSPVFCFNNGIKPANAYFLRRIFKDVVKRAGLSSFHFTPHSCRHYFALQIYLQKHNLMLVKELLGHRTLNATEVYLRLAAPTVFLDEGYTNPLTLCEKVG